MKKVVVLYNLNHYEHEYEAEFDSQVTIDAIENVLKDNYNVKLIEATPDFKWIQEIIHELPDIVFNICEGYYGPARESVYAALLEQFQFLYTGPDSTNLLICHNKSMVKKILKGKILVPNGYSIRNINDVKQDLNVNYPIIVKLNSEGSSIGLSKDSIVYDSYELLNKVEMLYNLYKSNILIEEYIDGIDISVIYIEGIGPLGPCTVQCDAAFYDYEMKTVKDDTVDILEAKGDYSELYEIVRNIVRILDIKGYAKLDFRVTNNKYYLIEVNGQVSFHPYGEFITCAKRNGYSFNEVINYIVEYTLKKSMKEYSFGIGEDYGSID